MSCGCNGPGDPIKPQGIRILDVWIIGPLMLYASTLLPKEKDLTRFALRSFGLVTIVYNARNYMVIKDRQNRKLPPVSDETNGSEMGRTPGIV